MKTSQEDFNKFRACGVRMLLSPLRSADKSTLPELGFLNSQYTDYPAYGPCTMTWDDFLALGER